MSTWIGPPWLSPLRNQLWSTIFGTGGGGGTLTLGALSIIGLPATLVNGTPSTGTIGGTSLGSTLSASGLPSGFTINSAARTWAYDGTVF